MYHEHFGFEQDPFNITPDSAFLFPSRRHREAMAALMYGIEQRKGFIALTGEIGSGKTTICRALLKELDRESVRVALILNPQLSDLELLQAINAEYGLDAESTSKRALLDTLNKFLLEQYENDRNCVLIVDESQRLSPEALEQIRLISNLELESTKLIQIALVGQPELDDLLHLPELEQLNQRIMVRYHIDPLGQDEMAEYIEHRLTVANPDHKITFQKRALRAIYDHTGGVPRRVNVVCDRALLVTFVAGAFDVTEDRARQAITETTSRRAAKRSAKPSEETRRLLGVTSVRGSEVFLPPGSEPKTEHTDRETERARSSGGGLLFAGCLIVAAALVYAGMQFSGSPVPIGASLPGGVERQTESAEPVAQLVPITPDPAPATEEVEPTATPLQTPQPTASPTPRTLAFQPVDRSTPTLEPPPEPTPEPTAAIPTPEPEPAEVEPVEPEEILEVDDPELLEEDTTIVVADLLTFEEEETSTGEQPAVVEAGTGEQTEEITEVAEVEEGAVVAETQSTSVEPTTWYYDGTGVMRVDEAELSYAASVLTWVSLTQDQRLEEAELSDLRGLDAATIARFELTRGAPPLYLREAQIPGILEILTEDHLPALLQLDRRATAYGPWAVLLDRVDGEAILADPLRGRVLVDEEELSEYLASVMILYPDPEGITDLGPADSGERVQALQRRLAQLGLLGTPPTGVFDSRTRRALEEYRQYKQLPGGLEIDPVIAVSLIGDTSS